MLEYAERGLVFHCGDNRLVGVVSVPEGSSEVGVLFLVGGPQYRVGSHRQFAQLARKLAGAGVAAMRFDYPGMGDSEGTRRDFSESSGDIFAAIEVFMEEVADLKKIVLWGLCDAASTAMMYGHRFPQVAGMVLLNPWVRSGDYAPGFTLSHYYRPRMTERAQWRRVLYGQVNLWPAIRDVCKGALALIVGRRNKAEALPSSQSFVHEMLYGLQRFKHNTLIILSEEDLTAKEFSSLLAADRNWQAAIASAEVGVNTILQADHTFSKRRWQEQVSRLTLDWVKAL